MIASQLCGRVCPQPTFIPASSSCVVSRPRSVACQCSSINAASHQQDQAAQPRRAVLLALSSICMAGASARASRADDATTLSPPAPPPPASAPSQQIFLDDEYSYLPPNGFNYVDIPIPRVERGPAPERNPLRSRFESSTAAGTASLSVVVRNAQNLGFTLMQVGDISAYGSPEEAAKLLVPRGSVLLSATSEVVDLPPRETPMGLLDIPPKTYYLYEILTNKGEHIAMAAAAARGKVFVCGGAAPKDQWPAFSQDLVASVRSFRLK